jgi:hypothetical protein
MQSPVAPQYCVSVSGSMHAPSQITSSARHVGPVVLDELSSPELVSSVGSTLVLLESLESVESLESLESLESVESLESLESATSVVLGLVVEDDDVVVGVAVLELVVVPSPPVVPSIGAKSSAGHPVATMTRLESRRT